MHKIITELLAAHPELCDADFYISWLLNETGHDRWETHANAGGKYADGTFKGYRIHCDMKAFITTLSTLPHVAVLLGGEGCYGDNYGVMNGEIRQLLDQTNAFGYTGSPVLKQLQKSSEVAWHCKDTAWNKRTVLKMCMAWAEAHNLVRREAVYRSPTTFLMNGRTTCP